MLERIRLAPFQCHDHLDLDLDPLTVLWGETGTGKSAVVRAVHWACLSGNGAGFAPHGNEEARAEVTVDGQTVVRGRTKSKHYYELDGSVSGAVIRQGIPEEVRQLLAVIDANFGRQFDPPFLLACTAAEAARMLNRTVSLDLIDDVLSELESGVRAADAAERLASQRVEEAQTRAASLAWCEAAGPELDALQARQGERDDLASECSLSRATLDRWRGAVSSARATKLAASAASGLGARASDRAALAGELRAARLLLAALSREVPRPPEGLLDLLSKRAETAGRLRSAGRALNDLRRAEEESCRLAREAGEAAEKVATMLGTSCPLCGR